MPRPFAYNPSQTSIAGTTQLTNLAIGVDEQDYSSKPGNVTWWMGPDETDAYIICLPVPAGNQPTPVGNVGTVKFWKTIDYSDTGFLTLINTMSSQALATATDAYDWCQANGYWTNYVVTGSVIFVAGNFTQLAEPQIPLGTRLTLTGAVDSTFAIGTGFNSGTISFIYELANGKIAYGGGTSMSVNSQTGALLILNTDGSVDTTFKTNMGSGFNGVVTTMVQQSDGKLVCGGTFTTLNGVSVGRVARLNSDGTPDTSFNTNIGATGFNSQVYEVKLFPSDSKICVCGSFTSFQGVTMYYVAKINTDGTRDVSFSSPSNGFNGIVQCVHPQSDGTIYCSGNFTLYNNSGTNARGCLRLTATGGLDSGWATGNGFLSSPSYPPKSVDLGDGIVYYGGASIYWQGTNTNIAWIKLKKSDASRDMTFNTNFSRQSATQFTGISINRAGTKALVIGGYGTQPVIFNFDGTDDATFNVGTGYSNSTTAATGVYAASGVYLPYSGVYKRTALVGLGKIKNTGYIDTAFTKALSSVNTVKGFTPTKDGKIIAYGTFTTYDGHSRTGLTKFSSNGSRDTTFAATGVTGSGGGVAEITKVLEYSDGRLLFLGRYTVFNGSNRSGITRTNSTGATIDTNMVPGNPGGNWAYGHTTGTVGSLVFAFPQNGLITKADQKLVVFGAWTNWNLRGQNTSENIYKYIMRFTSAGALDDTWLYSAMLNGGTSAGVEQADGKIVVIGSFTAYGATTGLGYIIRFNTDGTRDATFNSGTGFNAAPTGIVINPDDTMYVFGSFTSYNGTTATRLVKLTSSGTIDTTFAGYTTGISVAPSALQVADDGGVWVTTTTLNFTWNGSAQSKNGVMKLLPDGTLDPTWDLTSITSASGPSALYVKYPTA